MPVPLLSPRASPEATRSEFSKVSEWEGQEVELPSRESHVNLLQRVLKCEQSVRESEVPDLWAHTTGSKRGE